MTPSRERERELEQRWRRDYRAAVLEAEQGREARRALAERLFHCADNLRAVHATPHAAAIAAAILLYT